MSDITLKAQIRENFGKGFARRERAAGRVPAVLYGHGQDPVHLTFDGHAMMMALKHPNALLQIEADGLSSLAVAREVQRHPVKRNIVHVDLIIVKRGEKIEVEIPVHVVGDAQPGTLVSVEHQVLRILADAANLPDVIEVSVAGRGVGDHIFARDVALPAGSELATDGDTMIINVSAEMTETQLESELESDAQESGEAGQSEPAEAQKED